GADHVHIGRGDLPRPDDALVVVGLFHDRGDHPGHPDAVGTHGDALGLAVGPQGVHLEGVGVLPAELEDVPDLDAARRVEGATSVRGGVPVASLRDIDGAVRGEVPAHDQVDDVVVRLVGAGDPTSTVHHSRIHEIADLVVQQRL